LRVAAECDVHDRRVVLQRSGGRRRQAVIAGAGVVLRRRPQRAGLALGVGELEARVTRDRVCREDLNGDAAAPAA